MRMSATRFARDTSGNFGIITALVTVPLLTAVGMALDFGYAIDQRNDLLAAADAAAVGALASQSVGVLAALAMEQDGVIKVGEEDARKFFQGQTAKQVAAEGQGKNEDNEGVSLSGLDVSVTKSGADLKSEVKFTAKVPTTFLRLINQNYITISGSATAVYNTGTYIDFYMLLDNTPSMGVGATDSDIATMERNTSDSCAFACHQLDKSNNYYALAKSLKVQMRIDVVRQATQQLTYTAADTMRYPGQYRMAVYTFGSSAENTKLTQVASMSTDMAAVRKSADAIDLMTIPYQNYNNDMATDIDEAMTSLKTIIKKGGGGASKSDPQKVVFFVSDGLTDSAKAGKCTKKTTNGTRCQEPIDYSFCKPLKDAGIKVAVLYTTYLPLPKNGWYNSWIKPFQSEIAKNMEACASPGFYFEVSPSEGISDAMTALFQKIVSTPRISS